MPEAGCPERMKDCPLQGSVILIHKREAQRHDLLLIAENNNYIEIKPAL
jgi:hypothetical protein